MDRSVKHVPLILPALLIAALAVFLSSCAGEEAPSPPPSAVLPETLPEAPPDGLYAFDSCLYMNALSSFLPIDGTGELYLLSANGGLTILREETGAEQVHYPNDHWQSDPAEVDEDAWPSLFSVTAASDLLTLSGYSRRLQYELSDGVFLYYMDDEVWLGELGSSGMWSLYRLKPAPQAMPASDPDPEGIVDDSVDVSPSVLAGAEAYVRAQYDFWRTEPNWYYMEGVPALYDNWRIDSIEEVFRYPAQDFGVEVAIYLLDYRLHTLTPSLIPLAGGMSLDADSWLTTSPVNYLAAVVEEDGPAYVGMMPANDYTPGAPFFDSDLLELLSAYYGWTAPAD